MTLSTVAIAVAFALDVAVGEPPEEVHPVAGFGQLIAPLDRTWSRPRLVGAIAAVLLPLAAALVALALVGVVTVRRPVIGAVLAGTVLFASTSLRRLLGVAREVSAAIETDLGVARDRLRALAGRDATSLSPGQLRSAVVESLAENLADGLVGPLGAFALLAVSGARLGPLVGVDANVSALSLASGGAVWVKAVNTMDSMLGYRSKPVGWASARLDDAVMWLPARASAVLLAAASRSPSALVRARRWTDDVSSPNAGWPMGTIAAAVGVRLEKPGAYALNPDSPLPASTDAEAAVRATAVAGGLAYLCAGVAAWL